MCIVRLASKKELLSRDKVYIREFDNTAYSIILEKNRDVDILSIPHIMYEQLHSKDLKLTKEQLHNLQRRNGVTINGWVVQLWMLRIEDLIKYKLL